MSRTGMTRRAALATASVGAVFALAACGSDGVLTDGNTAATFGSTTVTTDQVQSAVAEINRADPQGKITGQQAAVLIALEPAVSKLAGRYGSRITPSQVEQEYAGRLPKGQEMDPSAIRAIQASVQLNALSSGQNRRASAAAQKLVRDADISLNPRYGEFSKGSLRTTPTNWIDRSAAAPEQ